MKKYLLAGALLLGALAAHGKEPDPLVAGQNAHYEVTLATSEGTIRWMLYNDTPRHRDNMVKLVQQGFYDHLIFHRVIRDFMIQIGDPKSSEMSHVTVYGNNDAGYKLDAEILPNHFHKRGAIAAAREGDATNPERKSSGSQFYIVVGAPLNDQTLQTARDRIALQKGAEITPECEAVYRTEGGTPHLDGSYTVFGEVVSGMDVVLKISKTSTDRQDRPKNDVYVKSAKVELVPDKK